jgi:superfamily II DNA or RNA helicase
MPDVNERRLEVGLDEVKPLYFLPDDNLAEDVLIPAFAEAESARCMAGFFSSASLADLAAGLATYIARAPTSFRLIVSPFLSDADQEALRLGSRSASDLAEEAFFRGMPSVDDLQRHTLRCLSYLLASGKIEIRIALMKNALFHPKVWIFEVGDGSLGVHGSSNMTSSGIRRNYEQVAVAKAWAEPTQRYVVEKLEERFERLWNNTDSDCVVLALPDAVRMKLLQNFMPDRPPTEDEYRELYKRATYEEAIVPIVSPSFAIPPWLKYDEGPFEHQGRAVRAWVDAGYRGILEMATGSGKTLTSLMCAYRLFEHQKPLLIVVAAPYVPLIEQWCGEIALFGLRPVNLTIAGGAAQRARLLQQLRRRLHLRISDVEIVVTSHDTLCTSEFASAIAAFSGPKLLIADEVHNLGRGSFISDPPTCFEYRLGLSATPVRQYDQDGTDQLFSFFGPSVFQFTLAEAIGRCLVEYDYVLHPVSLSHDEMDAWNDLTARIRKNAWRQADGKPDDYLAKLLRDRRQLLETAREKVEVLESILDSTDTSKWRHTLIYTTDKDPQQLRDVNALLAQKGVLYHQLTAEETVDREQTRRILESFQRGDIQVLTAKRVLDEGVNIPQICTAYVLASTTVERQWIQRRGRLLRTCPEIGKTHSVIHDFLALPPDLGGPLDDARKMIKAELRRAQEFASLARNAGRADGPLEVIHQLVRAAHI